MRLGEWQSKTDKEVNPDMSMEEKKGLARALCLRCMIALEDAGYECETIGEGKITCEECGTKCWGRRCRVYLQKGGQK